MQYFFINQLHPSVELESTDENENEFGNIFCEMAFIFIGITVLRGLSTYGGVLERLVARRHFISTQTLYYRMRQRRMKRRVVRSKIERKMAKIDSFRVHR